ncbi:MAG: 2-oxoacid:acceptor oxidoreductase family protein [bacterium]|jgi:2-oxoglutarate ferredoxin oxidoreductase subunit gamma
MEHRCIFSGFGGQGIVSLGTLVANAGMADNRYVTFFPSYGIAMRGGMASCTIVVSDHEINSPIVNDPTVLMVMDEASYDCFHGKVASGGLMFVNSSLVNKRISRPDVKAVYINATGIALEHGDGRMANMVMLGAVIKLTRIVSFEAVETAINKIPSVKLHSLIGRNLQVMKLGFEEAK